MKLIFERSSEGKRCASIKRTNVQKYRLNESYLRSDLRLPEVSEIDLVRHYTELSKNAFGVDSGFYPLGSCTMKYNPKVNEEAAALKGFTDIHPYQPQNTVQGALQAMDMLGGYLAAITGMDAITLAPNAGAHGEYTGLLLIDAYHKSRNDFKRTKVIVPDSAHGTNPASASVAGFEVVSVRSDERQGVDLDDLRRVVDHTTAAIMLTNPSTLGLFEVNAEEISKIVHDAGGLLYYDGANLNAIMGIVRPGDLGFDVIHLNLHKTFSTPHGGGGPGSGPVGCKQFLADFLPSPRIVANGKQFVMEDCPQSIGAITSFYGNFGVCIKALTYIITLGADGLRQAAQHAVLNANYLKANLQDIFPTQSGFCMHEFVLSAQQLKDKTGVSALDLAKAMIDGGIHPPTIYFPLIVHEALMIEPTETEGKHTLDEMIALVRSLHSRALSNPDELKQAPTSTPISRPDEVRAARQPILKNGI